MKQYRPGGKWYAETYAEAREQFDREHVAQAEDFARALWSSWWRSREARGKS